MREKELFNNVNQGFDIAFNDVFQTDFAALMRKVYLWMTLALLITGFTAYLAANSEIMVNAMIEHYEIFLGVAVTELVLVYVISSRIQKLSLTQGTLLFILYSLLNGFTLTLVVLAYTEESVTQVFLVTAATFGVMTLYGYTTKKDMTTIGNLFFFALMGIILATVVNIFLKSSMMSLIISYVGVLVFVGLTAYDTQKIKKMLLEESQYGDGERGQKNALLGALALYLDFINLFLHLIKIMGKKR